MFSKSPPRAEPVGFGHASSPSGLARVEPDRAAPARVEPARAEPGRSPNGPAPTVLQPGLKIVGATTVMSDGAIDLLGELEGGLVAQAVTVGASGRFKGELVAETVTVAGLVEGRITARRIRLDPGARVSGDLVHESLAIAEGAELEGGSRRKVDQATWSEISRAFDIAGATLTPDIQRMVDGLRSTLLRA